MPKHLFIVMLLMVCCRPAYSKDNEYNAAFINKDLIKHADVVVRNYELEIDIESPTKVYVKEHRVVTIMNEKGNIYANQSAFYSELESLESVEGEIYDKDGNVVKKVRRGDFATRAAYAGTMTYSDEMQRYYIVDYRQYPYTVEYTVKTRQKHTFHMPEWTPQKEARWAVERASLEISAPVDLNIRFDENKVASVKQEVDKRNNWHWEVSNISAFAEEPHTYQPEMLLPWVKCAANTFECQGYSGNMETWKGMGSFIYDLNKDRDTLPDEARQKVKELTANVADRNEKIAVLYKYMQQTTRYVSIQYGIGGWQTIEAADVFKNKYGDCKALSNYMKALLKEAGIPSCAVIIYGTQGVKRSLTKDFPHCEGNHEILCVPSAKDTVWLECTSTDDRINYLNGFTDDRTALMITPAGGVLVHTPTYDTNANYACRHAQITCTNENVLKISMNNRYSGLQAGKINRMIKHAQPRDIQEYENAEFNIPSYSADKYSFYPIPDDRYMAVAEQVDITANSMCNKRGNRYFINMNVAPLKVDITHQIAERKNAFQVSNSIAMRDTFILIMPPNTTVESLPEVVTTSNKFGRYHCSVEKNGAQLVMIREYVIFSGNYDRLLYTDYQKFLKTVNDGIVCNAVLVGN